MKNIAFAFAALVVLAGGCASEPQSTADVVESDLVKTSADAIRIGVAACGNVLGEKTRNPADWEARFENKRWVVFYKDIVSVDVATTDGRTSDCMVVITAD